MRTEYWTAQADGYVKCERCGALVCSSLASMLAHVDSKHAEPARKLLGVTVGHQPMYLIDWKR